ncbi:gamma-glutamyl-gamma-aminobutyrate hydrolase family protein [Ferrimicrobium acidiphilum]|uniref:Putative glutamine amidotransferasec n=1 Tax=Ferrimicrobium acidiphilum DSM 19497 TaxID=1121877 RepID=A0A0D8FS27_9ACTN|nr:gamma-glutamyl-gamma-aminobutyrate hydrolase family protein [Ferrimicrobium acidiphilum]KJE75739.1 putative glutamine amidotransferasec [Ferrimicrobium acidiphilum DSM 19497]MCL5052302.1 gamma-glutamyl-gamma-aminobutyrate hydrolase family protein [Gammaproteobacteria bacterium]
MARVLVSSGQLPKRRAGVHEGYLDALSRLGSYGIMLPGQVGDLPDLEMKTIVKDLISSVDALMLTGGGDVDPAMYGETVSSEKVYGIEANRDRVERALLEEAFRQERKVLAICRGIQVVNVFFGGTLIQDLETVGKSNHSLTDQEYEYSHSITVSPDSELARLLPGITQANSLHHQAVDKVGVGLVVTATSEDGVVEAVERSGLLAVQWHPERLIDFDPIQLNLFRWLVG